jgi:hypothetical protein
VQSLIKNEAVCPESGYRHFGKGPWHKFGEIINKSNKPHSGENAMNHLGKPKY